MEFKENQKFKITSNAIGVPDRNIKNPILTIVRGPREFREYIPESATAEELATPRINRKEWRCKISFIRIDPTTKKEKPLVHRYWLGEDYLSLCLEKKRMVEINEE